ncbi:MAG TPA: S9 family peptidase [Steroidobacteraceae bacterium]|jgi:acylaminoacyl-peptidase|nr:S9 family peptidase [Steroidobacteraceae bacterium]
MGSTLRAWFTSLALAASLGLYATAGDTAEPAHKLSASDEFQIQLAADPQISPDGKRVVYVRRFADPMTDKRYSNLWIVNSDGTDHQPLTSGNEGDSSPRWSPDGKRLAYLSDKDGKQQLYVRWMDTGQTARLTNLDEGPDAIDWSPDGKYLSFSALVTTKGPQVAELPAPPSGAKWAEAPTAYDRLVYRFNGLGYLKNGFRQLFVVSAEGGTPRQLTSDDFPNGGDPLTANRAVWSKDGRHLIVSINRHPDADLEPFDSEVYELGIADGTLRALTHRKGPDDEPVLSPDGRWIAYTGFDDRYQGHQTRKLYVMARDGTGSHAVSDSLDRDVQSPRWAPDSSGVYFLYDDEGDTKLALVSLGGKVRKIADHVASTESAYGGGSFSVSRTGAIAFTSGNATVPGNVALWSRGEPRPLTALNQELLTQKPPGRVEEIWYESSKDQRRIQGWIIYPPDFDPAKKYPLILEIHGGPFGDYGDRFDFEKQVYAARGYVLFYANPRGSTSYGEQFANLIHQAYPGDDFYDLNSGVDAVVAKGFVDTDNLFVTGGSGGGVLTCWMIEHTERFRAAASLYPVINWYSFALTSDIPFITKYWFPGNPWDNADQYVARSPITRVGVVKTPTLLMTGEADYRTPISEAEQFYEALKLRNIESVLVRVPEEPHGIARRPSHHVAKMLYVAGWFDQHRSGTAR